jgi:hypothetical protein
MALDISGSDGPPYRVTTVRVDRGSAAASCIVRAHGAMAATVRDRNGGSGARRLLARAPQPVALARAVG